MKPIKCFKSSYSQNQVFFVEQSNRYTIINDENKGIIVLDADWNEVKRIYIGEDILLPEIIYVDFSSHRVTLHCKYDVDTIVRTSFSEIESLLCAYPYFSSPTKGMLINFYEVASQTNDVFVMSDGKSIPISRRKSKEVLDAYFTFRFEMLRNGGGK